MGIFLEYDIELNESMLTDVVGTRVQKSAMLHSYDYPDAYNVLSVLLRYTYILE